MSTPGAVRLEVPDLVHAVPGGPFEFDVRVTHLADHDTSVLVRVVGALVGLEPARVVDLPAGVPVTTSVRMALPDGMSPGQHRVVVEVVERTVGQVIEASEVTVAIARTRGVTITMTPETVSKRRKGKYRAMISNHDDVEQRLRLKPLADRPGLSLVVSPEEVTLPPGQSVTVAGRLKMKGFWIGQFRERWFTLLGESSGASVYGRGLVLQKPIIGRSITRLVGLVAVLAVWLTGTLVVMRLLDPVTDDAATSAEAAVDPGQQGPNIPFGDGETKATITVSGTVTAVPDGSGVTVLYRPVTLADTDLAEGKATPTVEETEVAGLRTETDADGAFEVAGLDANGIFEFRFAKAGHNTLTRLVQPNGEDAVVEVTLEVGSGVISGTVVGPLGGPRGGVTVTLSDGAITYTTATPSSGEDAGRFSFNNLSTPGTYVLDARATGFGLASTVVELESGGVQQDVVLQISPDIGVLSGRVTSTAFESLASVNRLPAKGVMITATDGTVTRTTSTLSEGDLAGTFRLVGLPLNRTYTVTYEGAGYSPRTELVDFTANFEPLDISLIPSTGRLRGTVTTPPETVSPAAVAVTLASPDNTYKSTDAISADGELLLTGIAPGTYVAIFQSTGLADQVRDVTISAGQTSFLDVDMAVPPGGPGVGTIEVAVIDSASLEPINADVTMRFRSTACGTVAGTTTGTCRWNASAGALTITNLEAGAYTLGFSLTGYRPDLATVDVTPGQTVPVEMQLAPLGSVQGIVQDADGGALQGANLTLYEANPDDSPGAQVATAKVNDKGEYRFRRVMFSRNYVLGVTLSGYTDVQRPITGAVASTVNLDVTLRSDAQIAGQLQTLDLVTGETDPVSLDNFTVYLKTGYNSTASAWVDLLPQGLVRTLGGYRFGVTPNKKEGVTTSASAKYALCIQRNEDGVFDPALCDTGPPEFVQVFDNGGQGIEIEQSELRVISATFTPFPASVSGVVRLPNGSTVPEGLTVELRRVDFDNKVLDTFTTTTDVNGRFGFDNMAPTTQIDGFKPPTPQPLADGSATATGSASSWRIQVRSESGSYNGVRFDLGPNSKYDMDVRMQEGTGRLELFMMDDLGDPIRNAVVYVMRTTTGAQNITYDDLRYGAVATVGGGGDRCGSLPAPADIALNNGVPLSGCTDASGSINFPIVTAPVQYYVAIGMADTGGYAELLKQVLPIKVNIDATESRSLRQTWYYGDANIIVAASDTDRVPTATLAAPGANQVKITYELIATTGATPVPEDDSILCYRENVYTWLGQTGTEGLTPNGECFINDMRPGTYRVTAVVRDPDLQKILQTTTSAIAIVQPGRQKAVVPITIPVIQRELQVRVIDGATNATVSGATVAVKSPTATVSAATKSTGSDGTVTFSSTDNEMPEQPGIVLVTVGYPGFSTISATVTVRTGEQQTITVVLESTQAEARVAVVDTAGVPILGADVRIDGVPITEASCVVPLPGWYCLRSATQGISTVVVSKAGYRTVTVPMAVANPGGGSVTVVLGATEGIVVVDAMDAATGADISLGAGTVSIVGGGGSLAVDGASKTFTGLTPGVVRIAVAAQGPYAATTISATVVAGATTSATARLNRVSEGLVITVVDTLGNPVPGATVFAGTSGALALCAGGVTNRYCWSDATPGVVSVSATKAGYTSVLLYTTVDGNGTGSIALVVRELTGNLLVNVVDAVTGQPITVTATDVTVGVTALPCTTVGLAAGQCRFDGLANGLVSVTVSGGAAYRSVVVTAGVPLDGQTGTVTVALTPVEAELRVRVVDQLGGTVPGATVSASVGSASVSMASCGDAFCGLAPIGVASVTASASSYTVVQVLTQVTSEGGSVTVVLRASTGNLLVALVDDVTGLPINISSSLDKVTLGASAPACTDYDTGRCLFSGVTAGVVTVSVSNLTGYSDASISAAVLIGDQTTTVTLRLRVPSATTGDVVLVISDASTGQPITSGLAITATNSGAASVPAVDTSGAGLGRYGLTGYESGVWTVTVSGTGYVTRVLAVRVQAGVSVDVLVDLASNVYALVGNVTAAVGGTATSALGTATVTLGNGTTTQSAVTDAAGRYVFASVSADTWTVSVDATWAAANGYDLTATSSASVAIVSGAATVTQDLVVDAKPGALDITVRAATGALASGVDVWVDVNRDGVRDAAELVASNASGVATLSAIPAGVYQIELSDPSQRYVTTSALVMVERDRTTTLTFRLASWGVNVNVAVEVVPVAGLAGEPVAVWVRLVGASSTLTSVSTTSNGALALATFQNVPADVYAVQLSADNSNWVAAGGAITLGGVPYTVPDLQAVTVGSDGFDVDTGLISLARQNVDVTIRVLDRSGNAVNGVQIGVTGTTLLTARTAFTTTSGEAVVSLPAEATFDVTATRTNYGATQAALTVASAATTLNLVLNPDDAVLEVVAVEAASPSTSIALGNYNVTVSAASDPLTASGTYGTTQTHYPGEYRVRVSVPGYVDYVTTISLAPGERRTVTAPLTAVGASTASVTVSAINAADPSTAVTPTAVQLTRVSSGELLTGDGNFAYHDITPDTYRVSVSATGYVDYVTTFSLAAGEQLTLTARMTSNAVGGVQVSLRSTFGATVAAVPGEIFLVNSSGTTMPSCTVDPADDSMCVFTDVPAGPYSVTVSATGYSGFESISVVTGTTTSATVTVNFTATALFTVTDSAAVVQGATVSVDGTGLACVTNASGECSISGLDPGASLSVTVTKGTSSKDNDPLAGWTAGTRSFTIVMP